MAVCDGFTLVEVLFAATLTVLLMAIAIPQLLVSVDRSRGMAATRYLASRMALARMQAVSRSAVVALQFREEPVGISFAVYTDGNRNGVRTQEIESGIDPRIEPPVRLTDLFPGVTFAVNELLSGSDVLRIGRTNLLSFSPAGTATPGTVYLRSRDGTQWAVRVLGATGRVRALRYDGRTRSWQPAF